MKVSLLLLSLVVAVVAVVWYHIQFSLASVSLQKQYAGQWAIVAGASEGMGAAWAEALCANQMNVLMLARRETKLQEMAALLQTKYNGVQVEYRVHDLALPNQEASFQEILSKRNYSLLVYNAAYSPVGRFVQNSLQNEYQTVDVNIRGVLGATHTMANHLLEQQKTGAIILMSSLAGITGTGYVANYAATKAWNTAFANGLHYELKPRGINVLACVAGATSTPNYERHMQGRQDPNLVSTPKTVVEGCLFDLAKGASSTSFPGFKNKAFGALLTMVLPTSLAVRLSSETMESLVSDNY